MVKRTTPVRRNAESQISPRRAAIAAVAAAIDNHDLYYSTNFVIFKSILHYAFMIMELMLGGLDNPSHATEFALAEMINQPELLQRATEELDNVVGRQRLVQESDIPKLNYVKACVRESFRLHPVTAFNLPHVAMENRMVGNYMIPKGSHVILSKPGLGRNPKVWNEPHKFKPERHLKNDGSMAALTEPDLKFISFSTGRRSCPGIVLGTTMTMMLICRLLHGFNWSAPFNDLLEYPNGDRYPGGPLVATAKPRLAPELYQL